jgi:two-component system NtrC family sensor kinase
MMKHASSSTGERYEVGLNAFLGEQLNRAYTAFNAKKPDFEIKIDRDFDASIGTVELSPQDLGRALQNLLSNAFDAVFEQATSIGEGRAISTGTSPDQPVSPDGSYVPTVRLHTQQEDALGPPGGPFQVKIRVCDNGPGIPKKTQDKIFEPFFTTKPTGQGSTGLGLSLAYDIVTQGHGGKLTVESIEGEGATFVITLSC